jgi:cell division protein FtsI (penicillin-binding protein 3)
MKARATRPGVRPAAFQLRLGLLFVLLSVVAVSLAGVAVRLQLVDHALLSERGDARAMRVVATTAHRGLITDRFNEPLAVSTPVDSVWVNPAEVAAHAELLPQLAKSLGMGRNELARKVSANLKREFLYVARGLQPAEARKVRKLGVDGVNFSREYRRYYPHGEVTGHVLGFTSIDDLGQEGVERSFDDTLAGSDGAKRVIQDRRGQQVEDVESIRPVTPGQNLILSLDLRIQYLAHRELKAALIANRARAGSVVVIDIQTGEVLAMVNQPAYNPNDREQLSPAVYRNRAVTDLFEPGSSIKPFFVAAALASGRYNADSIIDTGNGFLQVGATTVSDEHAIGAASLSTVIAKSSNVGMAMLALSLDPKQIHQTLSSLGFGQSTSSLLPAESAGMLSGYAHWRNVKIATMSHGYGLAVTPLQLAQAYATIGAFGVRRPITLQRRDTAVAGERVLDEHTCRALVGLLEAVTTEEGATGKRARIPGYRVAGKTGTAWKAAGGSYDRNRYVATFGGVVPASAPRLAAIVVIDEPSAGKYYGGDVAAPVFSAVLGGALRLMAVPPDDANAGLADSVASVQQRVAKR